jgi:hypothetical protein
MTTDVLPSTSRTPSPPLGRRLQAWLARIATRAEDRAQRWRDRFDARTARWPAVLLVAALAALAAATGYAVQLATAGTKPLPPHFFFGLELTFSASEYAAIVRAAPGLHIGWGFVADYLFIAAYPLFLRALYLWAERYHRIPPDGSAGSRASLVEIPAWSAAVLVLPFVAGALDATLENVPLLIALRLVPPSAATAPSTAMQALVWVGSLAAALKWAALGAFLIGLIAMLLSGPRGQVLWRLRFSVLAVIIGAVPLLVVAQGQDMLQRLVEGPHGAAHVVASIVVLGLTAIVVWYSARVLTLVRFESRGSAVDPWLLFFERNVPRMLAIALLACAAAAFANAGIALGRFAAVAIGGYLLAIALARWNGGALLRSLGGLLVRGALRANGELVERVGRAMIAIAGGALIVWPTSNGYTADRADDFTLRLASWAMLAVTWVVYLFVYYRRDLLAARQVRRAQASQQAAQQQLASDLTAGYAPNTVARAATRAAWIAGAVSAGIFIAFTVDAVRVGTTLGPLVVLSLTVANAVFVGSVLAYWGRKKRVPIVTVLVALGVLFSSWNDNHDMRTLPDAPRPDTLNHPGWLRAEFARWATQRAAPPGASTAEIPVFLVAASGGGLRAAYWTGIALAAVQDRDTSFASHVFAISGVSGGSLGGAAFAAVVRDAARHQGSLDCRDGEASGSGPIATCVRRFMSGDFLAPVLAKLVAPDFVQLFLPFPIGKFDRATALEQSWEASYRETTGDTTFAAPYLAMRPAAGEGDAPLLLLNTTHVQTGRRYVTMPVVDEDAFLDARSVHRALGGVDLRLSTAVHNSARFSYVSPAGRIERGDGASYGALVDGGYFENSGLATVADVRRAIDEALADPALAALRPRVQVRVIYLCNAPLSCRLDLKNERSISAKRGGAGEVSAPLSTLLHTRDARGGLARAQMVTTQQAAGFYQLNVCDSLAPRRTSVESDRAKRTRERIVDPPLGWSLSQRARDWMDASLTLAEARGLAPAGGQAKVSTAPAVSQRAAAADSSAIGATCREQNVAIVDSIVASLGRARGRP